MRKAGDFILIKNARILTFAGKTYEKGSILIKNNLIAEIAESIPESENDGAVIDAQGLWALPGLIDAHSHIGIAEEKKPPIGTDSNETTEPLTPYIRALDGINPMDAAFHNAIKAGITSVMTGPGSSNVVGGLFAFIKTHGRSIGDMLILEPAAMKVAFGENPVTNYGGNNMMPSTRMTVSAMLREELFDAQKYCESRKGDDKSFKPNFRKECWAEVFDKKIPLKAHVHRADDILTAIRIAKEYDLRMTLDHCTEGHLIAGEIKDSGFPAIIGPSLGARTKSELQYMEFKTAGILAKAGVLVAITTDHPVSVIQSLPVCAAIAAKEGLGQEEALRAITINPAKICGVAERVGSLEPGKDADIAIFDGNPLDIFSHCVYTIVNGEPVFDYEKSK